MKILIVSKFFYPTQNPRAFRAFELAKELASQGHLVKVYTAAGSYNYEHIEEKYGFEVSSIGKMKFAKVANDSLHKLSRIDKILNAFLGRWIHFPEVETALRLPEALRSESNYDLLISLALPHPIHWGCALAIRKNQSLAKTWVADCGDPLTGNKFTNYPFYFRYIENWAFSKADFLAVPIKEAFLAYDKKHHNKIKVIPQGFNFEKLEKSKVKNEVPTFAFAGTFYKDKRDPREFLNYLCSLKTNFKFIIYTKDTTLVNPYIDTLKDKIEIRGFIERSVLLQELSKMDFLVNFENLHKEQSPSKLIDYALTGRPILALPSKNIDTKLVNEFFSGVYTGKTVIENLEDYNIKNVVAKFLGLHKESIVEDVRQRV